MLRITNQTELQDSLREFKGNENFGLQVSRNNKPLQIYSAYSLGGSITFFYAYQLGYKGKVLKTYELSLDTLIYSDGQYLINPAKYFDNVTPANILPNGNYCLSFGNGIETFFSEVFAIYQEQLDGSETYGIPEVKSFENDQVFNFND
jgi:hypothetical protein